MEIKNQNYITFGKSGRTSQYTPHQIKIMRDMKKAALSNGWRDIYTGDLFSPQNPPTIEHIIPCSSKNSQKVKELKQKGFQINGLDNIFPVGSLGNSNRGSKPIEKTVSEEPIILKRLLEELEKYKLYKSNLIDGQDWVKRITQTLLDNLKKK